MSDQCNLRLPEGFGQVLFHFFMGYQALSGKPVNYEKAASSQLSLCQALFTIILNYHLSHLFLPVFNYSTSQLFHYAKKVPLYLNKSP